MKYYEQMLTKCGFGDGDSTPAGIEHYRAAYIIAVNAIAEKLGSKVRLASYDRPGMHNWCMILTVDAEEASIHEALIEANPNGFCIYTEVPQDAAMERAIIDAMEMDIDSYVTCRVSLSKASIKQLLALKPQEVSQ